LKRFIAFFTVIAVFAGFFSGMINTVNALPYSYEVERFSDVPETHWAYEPVHYFRYLNITEGIGNNMFGLGQPVKKSEFITMLVRLMGWELVKTDSSTFLDVDTNKWYHEYIETAVINGAISKQGNNFNPEAAIKREEIAETIIRSLGYEELAKQLQYLPSEFKDVEANHHYINMMKDFGITNGVDGVNFMPQSTAKKEEAVAMLIRMYERLNAPLEELHAFYAIKAFNQVDMIQDLSSVSFGWSRLEFDENNGQFVVATEKASNSDFYIPEGFSLPVDMAKQAQSSVQLNLFASNETKVFDTARNEKVGLITYLLSDNEAQVSVIEQLIKVLNNIQGKDGSVSFDGVVIDFENIRGKELGKSFNGFLYKLKTELAKYDKKLYVAVHPKRSKGQQYYDGYDYRTIGEIADKVILMAHDYNAISLTEQEMAAGYIDTPLTPIDEVYYALKAITDEKTGVTDPEKIWLQISFDAVQWKRSEGKVINRNAFRPAYVQVRDRMVKDEPAANLTINYSERMENPWVTFYNTSDGTENIIWFENSRSVNAKIKLARMFGIKGISLWRLGNIPSYDDTESIEMNLNVWQTIMECME
jgi:spore germination protein YaaH